MKKERITDKQVDEIVQKPTQTEEDIEKLTDWVLQVKEEIENEKLE